jgi:hypothetical protein
MHLLLSTIPLIIECNLGYCGFFIVCSLGYYGYNCNELYDGCLSDACDSEFGIYSCMHLLLSTIPKSYLLFPGCHPGLHPEVFMQIPN